MSQFEEGNTFGKGRPKGSGYVDRCTKWADKRAWKQLERIALGLRPLDKAEAKKLKKEEGDENFTNPLPDPKYQERARRTIIEYGKGKPRVAVEIQGEAGASTVFGILAEAHKANEDRAKRERSTSSRPTKTPKRRR